MTDGDDAVLDQPIWTALRGPHRQYALRPAGTELLAVRYRPEVTGFAALSDTDDPRAWAQLTELTEPGGGLGLFGSTAVQPPAGWTTMVELEVAQLTYSGAIPGTNDHPAQAGDELVTLTRDDVAEMLELVRLTEPGPFFSRTVDLGGYLGIRRDGQLVAMAGRRMQPPGWVELSAICTHPDHCGRGLSRRLINAVIREIDADGQRPFLHVMHGNPAAALYHRLGFSHRMDAVITVLERADEGT